MNENWYGVAEIGFEALVVLAFAVWQFRSLAKAKKARLEREQAEWDKSR